VLDQFTLERTVATFRSLYRALLEEPGATSASAMEPTLVGCGG